MLRKKLSILLAILLTVGLVFAVVGCSSDTGSDNTDKSATEDKGSSDSSKDSGSGEKLEMVFGHNDPVVSVGSDAAKLFAELVEEKSNGTMTIEVFPANQLGGNRDLTQQTIDGAIDFTMGGIGNLGDFMPEYNMMMAMFVFEDQSHIRSVVEGELGKRLAQKLLDEHGLRMISQTWDRATRQIVSTKKIVEPADLKGIVIRAGYPGAEVPMRALGASPTQIPLAEMYTALSQNVIQAVEMPWSYIVGESLFEVADYVIRTDNTFGTRFFAMNEDLYQKMTPEQRQIIMEAVEEAGIYNNQNTWAEIDEYKELLQEKGMEFVTPNREGMIDIVKGKIGELEELWEIQGLYEEIHSDKYKSGDVDYKNTAPAVKW